MRKLTQTIANKQHYRGENTKFNRERYDPPNSKNAALCKTLKLHLSEIQILPMQKPKHFILMITLKEDSGPRLVVLPVECCTYQKELVLIDPTARSAQPHPK